MSKRSKLPESKRVSSGHFLRNNDNTIAKQVVEESKDLPHLKKPIKYILK